MPRLIYQNLRTYVHSGNGQIDLLWSEIVIRHTQELIKEKKINFAMLVTIFLDYCGVVEKSGKNFDDWCEEFFVVIDSQVKILRPNIVLGVAQNLVDNASFEETGFARVYVVRDLLIRLVRSFPSELSQKLMEAYVFEFTLSIAELSIGQLGIICMDLRKHLHLSSK